MARTNTRVEDESGRWSVMPDVSRPVGHALHTDNYVTYCTVVCSLFNQEECTLVFVSSCFKYNNKKQFNPLGATASRHRATLLTMLTPVQYAVDRAHAHAWQIYVSTSSSSGRLLCYCTDVNICCCQHRSDRRSTCRSGPYY